jgi:hypothetical protein
VTPIERFANEHDTLLMDRRSKRVQRVAFAGAVFLVLVGLSPGLAYAADGAKPGDLLYGLDMAFEAVGFDNGGAAERLSEVEALIAAGAVADGLHHASHLFDGQPGSDEARAALTAAAVRLEAAGDSGGSQAAQVAGLIGYLHRALSSVAGIDAQTVAGMARDLGPPADSGSQADPVGPPADPGSQSSEPGRPEQGGTGK